MADAQGFAVVCDEYGHVIDVIRDTFGLGSTVEIKHIVDPEDRPKFERFLATVQSRQAAFDWSINVSPGARTVTLHFGAAAFEGRVLMIAAETRADLARLSRELVGETDRSTERLRRVLQESALQLDVRAEQDAHLYEELSRMTNELSATQRRLIKSNVDFSRANEQLRAFYETLPLGVFRTDPSGIIVQANARLTALTDSALGESWLQHVHAEDYAEVAERWEDIRKTGKALDSLHRRRASGNGAAHLRCRIVPLRGERAELTGFVGVIEDVTASREVERQARDLARQHAIHDVTAGVAHNLNNIMAVIMGTAEQMVEELPADHPLCSPARMNFEATNRGASLVRHLVMYADLSIARDELIDVNATLSTIINRLEEGNGPAGSVSFRPDGREPKIRADRIIISEAVEAILGNALQAVKKGGSVKIATRVEERRSDTDGMAVVIEVTDDGVGMDEATLRQAREPFFTTREVGDGVGLGLSFVDGVARRYSGVLHLESHPGRGTCVHLMLPLAVE